MENKDLLPFSVSCDKAFTIMTYSSRHDLDDALGMANCIQPAPIDDESLEAASDFLSQYADYVNGVWEGTDVPLNIDTIDEDDFQDILINADNGTI